MHHSCLGAFDLFPIQALRVYADEKLRSFGASEIYVQKRKLRSALSFYLNIYRHISYRLLDL